MGRHTDLDGNGIADDAEQHVLRAHAVGGLTGSLVRSALAAMGAVGGQMASMDDLAAGARGALAEAPPGLTPAGAAAFLATMAEESAHFRTTTEYGSGQRYAPYVGRTFCQLTWSSNYAAFGAWCKARDLVFDDNVFVNSPAALSDYRWAWLGGVFYFQAHNLWGHANRGDFLAVSQAVNGGDGRIGTSFVPNGWVERQRAYAAFLAAGDALLPGPTSTVTARKVLHDMPERSFPAGDSGGRIICPTGKSSLLASRAWFSASVDGTATLEVWAQVSGGGDTPAGAGPDAAAHRSWQLRRGDRPWFELPDGTEFVTYHVTGASGPGGVAVEQLPK